MFKWTLTKDQPITFIRIAGLHPDHKFILSFTLLAATSSGAGSARRAVRRGKKLTF